LPVVLVNFDAVYDLSVAQLQLVSDDRWGKDI
jgi:hypothetical protein